MADPVGAILLIISVTTSGTPKGLPDETHVMSYPYATMDECKADIVRVPLSRAELRTEQHFKLRVTRACILPRAEFWYDWARGKATDYSGKSEVEAGSYAGR